MSWETTVGTLGAERLEEIDYERVTLGEDEDIDALMDHIDALTAQLERARGIAVSLENEVAAALALHVTDMGDEICGECLDRWPCPTVNALGGAE